MTTAHPTNPRPAGNPLADALTPLQRRCWALAGAVDDLLHGTPLRLEFDAFGGRPWWHFGVLSAPDGWELQAGRWALSLDRPRRRHG